METSDGKSSRPLYLDFLKILKDIFREYDFDILEATPNLGYEFTIVNDDIKALVDVKLYGTKIPKVDLLKQACLNFPSLQNNDIRILIVTSEVSYSLRSELLEMYGVVVWDAEILLALSFQFGSKYYDVRNLLENAYGEPLDPSYLFSLDPDFMSAGDLDFGNIFENLKYVPRQGKIQKPSITVGKKLCEQLRKIKAGKRDAESFELKCEEILKHLFDNKVDLELWNRQNGTDDGLHRFDLLCRIITGQKNTFWTEIAHDFHCRYILFEFKNYSKPIKQAQIYSTEKYLFVTALRSVSFIIAKNDADENAKKAAKGALKEAGKLIVVLTSEDLCKMLDLKERGEEPSTLLRDRIDEILIKLTR